MAYMVTGTSSDKNSLFHVGSFLEADIAKKAALEWGVRNNGTTRIYRIGSLNQGELVWSHLCVKGSQAW